MLSSITTQADDRYSRENIWDEALCSRLVCCKGWRLLDGGGRPDGTEAEGTLCQRDGLVLVVGSVGMLWLVVVLSSSPGALPQQQDAA